MPNPGTSAAPGRYCGNDSTTQNHTTEGLTVFIKAPTDILDYEWDWSVWLPTGDTIDTVSWTAQSGITIQTLPAPTGLTAVASVNGGTIAAGTYFYKVTTTNAGGETTASNEVSVTTTGSTSSVALTWDADSTGTGSKIYRGTTTNGENVYQALSGTAQTFTDIGGTTTAGTVPGSNTAQSVSNTATNATIFIGGGTAGNTYTLTCQISTESGRVAQNTQNVNVINL